MKLRRCRRCDHLAWFPEGFGRLNCANHLYDKGLATTDAPPEE